LPSSKQTLDQSPTIAVIITPATATDLRLVDATQSRGIRCISRSTYLCPGHQTWQCPICHQSNQIGFPALSPDRIEISNPVYHVLDPDLYVDHPEAGLGFFFIIDMTFPSWSIGFTQQI
jgi:hypothetical protein